MAALHVVAAPLGEAPARVAEGEPALSAARRSVRAPTAMLTLFSPCYVLKLISFVASLVSVETTLVTLLANPDPTAPAT